MIHRRRLPYEIFCHSHMVPYGAGKERMIPARWQRNRSMKSSVSSYELCSVFFIFCFASVLFWCTSFKCGGGWANSQGQYALTARGDKAGGCLLARFSLLPS